MARIASENDVNERDLRDWFDRELISEQGLRGQVMGSEDLDLSQEAIGDLVDAHLVRAEERRGIQWYELAHDRLVKPINDRNTTWYAQNLNLLQLQAEVWNKNRDSGPLLWGDVLAEAKSLGTG